MRGSRNLCQRGASFYSLFCCCFFKLMRGGSKYHFKGAIIGPPAKLHLNGVSLAGWLWPGIECWLGSFLIYQGIRTSIAQKPYFCDFSGGSGPPAPLWIRPWSNTHIIILSQLRELQLRYNCNINHNVKLIKWKIFEKKDAICIHPAVVLFCSYHFLKTV